MHDFQDGYKLFLGKYEFSHLSGCRGLKVIPKIHITSSNSIRARRYCDFSGVLISRHLITVGVQLLGI